MKIELHDFDSCVSKFSNKILHIIGKNLTLFKLSEITLNAPIEGEYLYSTIRIDCYNKKMNKLFLDILNDKAKYK